MLLVAEPDHRRDRQRADRHGVGDGRARDHAEQGRAEDRHLGRAAGIAACHPGGAVEKELAEADARGEDAEQHEVEDVGRDDAEGDAVDALGGQVEMVDELREAGARMHEDAGHGAPEQGVEHEQAGDDRQRPADRAARRLEQHEDEHGPEHHVGGRRVADPEGELVERNQRHMRDGHHRPGGEGPIEQRDAERPQQARAGRLVVAALREREDEEDQAKHEGEMDAAMLHLGQQPEAGRVVVEQREDHEQRADQLPREGRQRPEADLGVEFLFELASLGFVEFKRRHQGLQNENPLPRGERVG